MKPGDLVTPSGLSLNSRSDERGCFLSPIPYSKLKFEKKVPKTIPFLVGEVGTVLELGGEGEEYFGKKSMKILTPSGRTGWCLHDWIEVVNETR